MVIEYKNLCKNYSKVIKDIYKFLNIPFYEKHFYTNLKQVDKSTKQTIIRTQSIDLKSWSKKSTCTNFKNLLHCHAGITII